MGNDEVNSMFEYFIKFGNGVLWIVKRKYSKRKLKKGTPKTEYVKN